MSQTPQPAEEVPKAVFLKRTVLSYRKDALTILCQEGTKIGVHATNRAADGNAGSQLNWSIGVTLEAS